MCGDEDPQPVKPEREIGSVWGGRDWQDGMKARERVSVSNCAGLKGSRGRVDGFVMGMG